MYKISEAIVVEGRYDKAALSSYLDAVILETEGFGVFSDGEKLALLRRVADKRGLVVLTDSDGGGFVIRNYLKSALPPDKVKHAYIPEIAGKERRKRKPGKEGKLGVEGMEPQVVLEALRRAGVTVDGSAQTAESRMDKADLFALGLSGGPNSAALRQRLLKQLKLPSGLTANAMLDVLNVLFTKEELQVQIAGLNESEVR